MKSIDKDSLFRSTVVDYVHSPDKKFYFHDITINDTIQGLNNYQEPFKSNIRDNKFSNTSSCHNFFLHCIDEEGRSVTIHVDDMCLKFSIKMPDYFDMNYLDDLIDYIENKFGDDRIKKFDLVEKQSANRYDPISKTDPRPKMNRLLEMDVINSSIWHTLYKYFSESEIQVEGIPDSYFFLPVDDVVGPIDRFLMETGIDPSMWFSISDVIIPKTYYTHSQIELYTSYKFIILDKEKRTMPSLVIMGYDIEVDNIDGFKSTGIANVICISTFACRSNKVEEGKVYTHYLVNKPTNEDREKYNRLIKEEECLPKTELKPSGEVFYFTNELEMLESWRDFVVNIIDPDIIIGHNITGYDWRVLGARVAVLTNMINKYDDEEDDRFIYEQQKYIYPVSSQYLIDRYFSPASRFFSFSKFIGQKTPLLRYSSQSSSKGEVNLYFMQIDGRITMDTYTMYKEHITMKFVNNTLSTISKALLNDDKEDIQPINLYKIWRSDKWDYIISYCEKDAMLPVRLIHNTKTRDLFISVEMSRTSRTLFSDSTMKGTTIRTRNLFIREAHELNMVLDCEHHIKNKKLNLRKKRLAFEKRMSSKGANKRIKTQDNNNDEIIHMDQLTNGSTSNEDGCVNNDVMILDNNNSKMLRAMINNEEDDVEYWSDDEMGPAFDEKGKKIKYGGAKVIEPNYGIHDDEICLDYSSLYPSIMNAKNLCPSTILIKKHYYKYYPHAFNVINIYAKDGITVERSHYIIKPEYYKGILVRILTRLMSGRSAIKREIASIQELYDNTKDPAYLDKLIELDIRQLAFKLTGNGTYGASASSGVLIGSRRVSESTTAIGRISLEETCKIIESEYEKYMPKINYGDTDSVMLNLNNNIGEGYYERTCKSMIIGFEMGEVVSKKLSTDLSLEMEKVFVKHVLGHVKKRYAGLKAEMKAGHKLPKPEDYPHTEEEWKKIAEENINFSLFCRGYANCKKGEPKIVIETVDRVLNMLLIENKSFDEISDYIHSILSKMIRHEYSIDQFIYYRKVKSEYKKTPPKQKYVVDKMNARISGSGYRPGDYVPYVCLTPKSANIAYDKISLSQYKKYLTKCADNVDFVKTYNQKNPNRPLRIDYKVYISYIKKELDNLFCHSMEKETRKYESMINNHLSTSSNGINLLSMFSRQK